VRIAFGAGEKIISYGKSPLHFLQIVGFHGEIPFRQFISLFWFGRRGFGVKSANLAWKSQICGENRRCGRGNRIFRVKITYLE